MCLSNVKWKTFSSLRKLLSKVLWFQHYLSLLEQRVIIIDFWFFSVVVAEEGAFHSVRCKLFYKRESDWVELGLGMMNLKKLEEKTQVLVRNDTTLGKILLNIYLAENTPISRSGKNNVILMSIPNPPLFSKDSEGDNSKPATYLIRVKTAQDADELHTQLNANKPSS